jgi:hypothetical protein
VRKALVLTGLAGLLLLAACGTKDAGGSGSPATTAPAKADPSKLGPDGYAGYQLGQSLAAVKAAGLDLSDAGKPCTYASADGPNGSAQVDVSAKIGIYRISAGDSVPTPEGLKIGATLAEALKAYPGLKDAAAGGGAPKAGGLGSIAVPGNAKAHYDIAFTDGSVTQIQMSLDASPDC